MTRPKHHPEHETYVRGQRVVPPMERIMSSVDIDKKTGCWNWNKTRKGVGLKAYGRLVIGSRSDGTRRSVSAHRYSFELFIGPIPAGAHICHHCDNPPCVNPAHLFSGTRLDNTKDREAKGRNKIKYGEDNGQSKLTNGKVLEIRRIYKAGGRSQAWLGRRYGVDKKTIRDIIHRRIWKNIPAPPQD